MKNYEDRIKEIINDICDEQLLKQPISVPSAGKMISTYRGNDLSLIHI